MHDRLAGYSDVAVAAGFRCEIDDNRTRLHHLDHVFEPKLGCRLAGDERSSDDDVDVLGLLAEQRHLCGDELGAHLFGVAALAITGFLNRDGEKFTAERLHLIGDRRAHVERTHDGAHALGRAKSGETGDAATDDEHLGWRNFTGRRDLSGEKTAEALRRFDHGAVAGDVGHRRQGVDFLCATDARDAIHRHRAHAAPCEVIDERLVLRRIEERNQHRAGAHGVRFTAAIVAQQRRANLDDDVTGAPRGGRIDDHGAGGLVQLIGKTGAGTGTGFDNDVPTGLDPLANGLRRGSDSPFIRSDFLRNS